MLKPEFLILGIAYSTSTSFQTNKLSKDEILCYCFSYFWCCFGCFWRFPFFKKATCASSSCISAGRAIRNNCGVDGSSDYSCLCNEFDSSFYQDLYDCANDCGTQNLDSPSEFQSAYCRLASGTSGGTSGSAIATEVEAVDSDIAVSDRGSTTASRTGSSSGTRASTISGSETSSATSSNTGAAQAINGASTGNCFSIASLIIALLI